MAKELKNENDSTIEDGLIDLGEIVVSMACPECLEAYKVYEDAKEIYDIVSQVLYLHDYILAKDFYKMGLSLGKITKQLKGLPSKNSLLIEVEELE